MCAGGGDLEQVGVLDGLNLYSVRNRIRVYL